MPETLPLRRRLASSGPTVADDGVQLSGSSTFIAHPD